jgi:hypothetical protein
MLINLKKQLDWLSKEDAVKLSRGFVEGIKVLKDANLLPHDEVDKEVIEILNKIKYDIIKEKMRRALSC